MVVAASTADPSITKLLTVKILNPMFQIHPPNNPVNSKNATTNKIASVGELY
jgi:hypothetical protein